MQTILFGTAGIPHSSKKKDSISGIERIKEIGLKAMELEFVYGVSMKKETAELVKKQAQKNLVKLSVHAPYYVNLNAEKKEKIEASKKRVLDSCRIGYIAGASTVLFHPGFYLKDSKEQTFNAVKKAVEEIISAMKEEKIRLDLRLETTGKHSAFGSLEEVVEISEQTGAKPCIDFSHLHARCNGCLKKQGDFEELLEKIPEKFLKNLHMHVSGINYSEKGERNHLNLEESDFQYKELLNALHDKKVSGTIICESPNLEDDAMLMQKHWKNIAKE
jgi:deoxyribonuclease IV